MRSNIKVLEKRANEFRNFIGVGLDDSIHLRSVLTKLNVITIFKPLGDGFSGMAIKIEKDKSSPFRFILVNSNHPIGKQHFTVCHELYHLFVQEKFTSRFCNTGKFNTKDPEEFNADWFAAFLLLPTSGIESLIPDTEIVKDKIKLKTILKIEHFFGCSRAALLYRLFKLGYISQKYYDELRVNVKLSAFQYGYDTTLYEKGNHNLFIGDYGSLARELFESNAISESHYFSLLFDLGLNAESIEKLSEDFDGEEYEA
ncbi:ImmA/IrrE family metallo-endopeptidase [Zhouia spongiae]|uniref:ImmA/IrrE family metallo-endopeptidase n=1 Tax=Zhouia spongiae TaxID=2202721 RepID=A0ABY3YQ72_9FLAO|nr:ImmA/IrrE family metallo-endopeptidase [Zhouia spongiae]UNY99760.1 ImmA/IrrE family metallo-endopeptidase [Zhouia spongiae]